MKKIIDVFLNKQFFLNGFQGESSLKNQGESSYGWELLDQCPLKSFQKKSSSDSQG